MTTTTKPTQSQNGSATPKTRKQTRTPRQQAIRLERLARWPPETEAVQAAQVGHSKRRDVSKADLNDPAQAETGRR